MTTSRTVLNAAVLIAALSQLSCAAGNLQPLPHAQPPERIGLAPEYRLFYDALQGQGDWVYVQPYGYLFRPDVNFITWRPYEDGFWAPTDNYGWTWISAEPFGWATYHYGQWLYDRYYGWLWEPGPDWGPAWVSWQVAGDYAGWSPLLDPGTAGEQIRGGPWSYAPLGTLGVTDLTSGVLHAAQLGKAVQGARTVRNMAERNGVVFNRGPKFELVEKESGRLPMVKIEEPAPIVVSRPGGAPKAGGTKGAEKAQPAASDTLDATRRAAADAAREARGLVERGGRPPEVVHVLRPSLLAPTAGRSSGDRARGRAPQIGPPAPADSLRR